MNENVAKNPIVKFNPVKYGIGEKRILSIDSLRGFAMVLVIMQHCFFHVNIEQIPQFVIQILYLVTYLAAVAFVSISGAVFSYSLYHQSNWQSKYQRYALRAVFMLMFAHPAINLANYFFYMVNSEGSVSIVERLILGFPITDTIAICLLFSPVFILGLDPIARALTIVIILATTPFIVAFILPARPPLVVVKEVLFGTLGEPSVFWWPLIPWLAIFSTGSFTGQALMGVKQGTLSISSFLRGLIKAGFVLATFSVVITAGYKLFKVAYGAYWSANLFRAFYPDQTTTLLPGYFAVLAWLLAGLMYRIDVCGNFDFFLWFLSILGRTSLFTFIIQFAVVESVPALLGFTGSLGLEGYLFLFFAGLSIVWLMSYSYGRARGWITINDCAECRKAAKMSRFDSE